MATPPTTSTAKKRSSLDNAFGCLAILLVILGAYFGFTNTWIAQSINGWQMNILGEDKYYPALTIFILAIGPLIILAIIKKLMMIGKKK